MIRIVIPPAINPMAAASHGIISRDSAISIPGLSNDQKLAAIMTPAANPSIQSRAFLLKFLETKTRAAPQAVIAQVKRVAIRA